MVAQHGSDTRKEQNKRKNQFTFHCENLLFFYCYYYNKNCLICQVLFFNLGRLASHPSITDLALHMNITTKSLSKSDDFTLGAEVGSQIATHAPAVIIPAGRLVTSLESLDSPDSPESDAPPSAFGALLVRPPP
jgi:hypothetical protein